jgi:hypothetical protein
VEESSQEERQKSRISSLESQTEGRTNKGRERKRRMKEKERKGRGRGRAERGTNAMEERKRQGELQRPPLFPRETNSDEDGRRKRRRRE